MKVKLNPNKSLLIESENTAEFILLREMLNKKPRITDSNDRQQSNIAKMEITFFES